MSCALPAANLHPPGPADKSRESGTADKSRESGTAASADGANRYVGRFAPSPTGPLHFGSLVAALASFVRAKSMHGRWLIRVDDIDPVREPAGAAADILHTLEAFSLSSELPVQFQSQRLLRYRTALNHLIDQGAAFPCFCTRSQLAGSPHRGRCNSKSSLQPSWRVLVADQEIEFEDAICGKYSQPLAEFGDFVVWRADSWPSYQLACVVDEFDHDITEVMRGEDLIDSTPRQIYLQQQLGMPSPNYAHLPLVLGADGQKLSKQNLAEPVRAAAALGLLRQAWAFLNQPLLSADSIAGFLQQAAEQFDLQRIARRG